MDQKIAVAVGDAKKRQPVGGRLKIMQKEAKNPAQNVCLAPGRQFGSVSVDLSLRPGARAYGPHR